MSINRIQFQPGMPLFEFFRQFATATQCEAALEQARWPQGFRRPCCVGVAHCMLRIRARKTFRGNTYHHQTSLFARTLFEGTKLRLRVSFLTIHLIIQAKTGRSVPAQKSDMGVSYPDARPIHHKLMQGMVERETGYVLCGTAQVYRAYLAGELHNGTARRGSKKKMPFVAAVPIKGDHHPLRAKLAQLPSFTRKAIAQPASTVLRPESTAMSDGLACVPGVTDAGCAHQPTVVAWFKPKEPPMFYWINNVLANVKTDLGRAYHTLGFRKYAQGYLRAINCRFNRPVNLHTLPL